MTRYLVALRRGDGDIEPCPEPISTTGVFALLRRLAPYQALHISVVPDRAPLCGCRSCPRKTEGPDGAVNTAEAANSSESVPDRTGA